METYAKLPLLFIHNQGQLDSQVEYYVKTPRQTIYLTPAGMVFDLIRYQNTETADSADRKAERLAFSLDFVGASTSPLIRGSNQDKAVVNYLIGNDPNKWHTDIATYREVLYKDVYPGIDLRLYGKENALEYEFIVQPGADVSDIALAYSGVDGLELESNELVVSTAFGDIKQSQPYIYQHIGNDTVAVAGGFSLLGADSYGFEIGAYDAGYPLIIDPTLAIDYSTYLGGGSTDLGYGIAVDSPYAYVTGATVSDDFPTKNEYQTDPDGEGWDVFVAKLDTTESGDASLIYSTYLGGSQDDYGYGIAVEEEEAYVTGCTQSIDFPTWHEYMAEPGDGMRDAFVTRLGVSGNTTTYSTYLGGNGWDEGRGIAVASQNAYVTGFTHSNDFPRKNQYDNLLNDYEVFVTRLDTTKSGIPSLMYSTYLGGSNQDRGYGIAVESQCAYVTGSTESTDFPTFNKFQTDQPTEDAFVSKLDTTKSFGASLIYSTYLGGNGDDYGYGIAVASQNAYVTGETYSDNFPTLNQYQLDQPDDDAFVTRIDTTLADAASLIYSTYLGGSGSDSGHGIAVDAENAYVTGYTYSDFPTLNQYMTYPGHTSAFVTRLDTTQPGDAGLIYSTYLGGDADSFGYGIAVDSAGCAYVTGSTWATDFPTQNEYQTNQPSSFDDAFVTKLELFDVPAVKGDYSIKGSIKFYDWRCNKWIVIKGGMLYITEQNGHKVEGYWEPDVALGWSDNVSVKGYVGPIHRDEKRHKIKNTPRLSLLLQLGTYCIYPEDTYATYIVNGKVKMDKKTELVKSIKCTLNGWGEYGDPFTDIGGPSQGQFEGKLTATPVPGGGAMPEGSMEHAPSAVAMPEPVAPSGVVPTSFATAMVAAGGQHTVGLKSNGTVVAVGLNTNGSVSGVSSWTGITQVAAGSGHTVGLESDGTVVAVGDNGDGQLAVGSWADITQIAAGAYHTVGLKDDGTVVAVGDNTTGTLGVDSWTGITQVAAGGTFHCGHTVGLEAGGTVVAVGCDDYGQVSDVDSWEHITQVAAGGYHTVGLRSDGTVVAVGLSDDHQLDVGSWTDIVQVAAGGQHTVGLKDDGTVVAAGSNFQGQCDVGLWTNIIQVAAGWQHTVGLRADGTVVATGFNGNGQCDVTGWNLAAIPEVVGDYPIKGSIKFYDWKCNKSIVVQAGTLHITTQNEHKITGYWEPQPAIEGWPDLVPVSGYVGPFYRDTRKGKVKNTPRLSLLFERGTYCEYPDEPYVTYIINGKVKWDKKTDTVKSIKCTINGWGEWGAPFVDPDNSASMGQFEGKFTASPLAP
jgi:alpha-tubulin suppressor-like RCC1 family protein